MEPEFSTPLTDFPAFLSSVSMVVDDREEVIRSLIRAERKSPSRYDPAKEIFIRILQGDFSVEKGLQQAKALVDQTERDCAITVLNASAGFLRGEKPAKIGKLPAMSIELPNKMQLPVSAVLLRHLEENQLLILHFWRRPLTDQQLSAIGAILRRALRKHQPRYSTCELDFIAVFERGEPPKRTFRKYNWSKISPMDDSDLEKFLGRLCEAWKIYQDRGPREIKRRRPPGLFD